jgi:nitrogen PTS system EIIA component
MEMNKVLPVDAVLLDVELVDKARAISEVAARLAESSSLTTEQIEGALLAREALGSTGVGDGVALPHARVHALSEPHAVFVRTSRPIVYESTDAKPVDLICAVVAPDEPSAALLTVVSAMAKRLRNQACKTLLRETKNADEARRALIGDVA